MTQYLQYGSAIYDFWNSPGDERIPDWPFLGSKLPLISVLVLYLWFVKRAGPNMMKNSQPYKIDRIIQVYNLAQSALSAYLFFQGLGLYLVGHIRLGCMDLSTEKTPTFDRIVLLGYVYFLLKVVDLLDTVFFVLRKKQSQITFLHVYHHVSMVVFSWWFIKYLPSEQVASIPTVNCFVHAVMYFYYFLSNYNSAIRKNIWWKKYVTQLQILQFGSLLAHSLYALTFPDCTFPRIVNYIVVPQNVLITVLFLNFYRKTYLQKPVKRS